MSNVVKLKQEDIEKIVFNIVNEEINETPMGDMDTPPVSNDTDAPHSDEKLEFGMTPQGEYVFYKKGLDGKDVVVKKFHK